MATEQQRVRVVDFYTEVVLPALEQRLDQAFPEFGWRRDARGWVATNEEHTHGRLGVRAERVVAHGPAPRGFLVHGGEPMLWTAYLSGGAVPHGAEFVRVVGEIASRAGVDAAPLERAEPRDRRAELLEEFLELARRELTSDRGAAARAYLDGRGFPLDQVEASGLGLVPASAETRRALAGSGFTQAEIRAAGVLADSRWPGRLCGAWRDQWGRVGTFWTRALDDDGADGTRYLYLRGASRADLPPYGLARGVRDLVLVEGFFDYHQLRARGVKNVAALGGTSTNSRLFERLDRLGVQNVTICLDNDDAGRAGTARAVENSARAGVSPVIYVVPPEGDVGKDPDVLVREGGNEAWQERLAQRRCGIMWRAENAVDGVSSESSRAERREALARVGTWLGTLPPRLALEQEDAVRTVSRRCGYSPEAVGRAFRARFFADPGIVSPTLRREVEQDVEL